MAVKVVGDKASEFATKESQRRVTGMERRVLSADGKSATLDYTGHPEGSQPLVIVRGTMTRVGPGPAGEGSPRAQKPAAVGLTAHFVVTNGGFLMTTHRSLATRWNAPAPLPVERSDYQRGSGPDDGRGE